MLTLLARGRSLTFVVASDGYTNLEEYLHTAAAGPA